MKHDNNHNNNNNDDDDNNELEKWNSQVLYKNGPTDNKLIWSSGSLPRSPFLGASRVLTPQTSACPSRTFLSRLLFTSQSS